MQTVVEELEAFQFSLYGLFILLIKPYFQLRKKNKIRLQ